MVRPRPRAMGNVNRTQRALRKPSGRGMILRAAMPDAAPGIGGLQDVESECDALASLFSRLEDARCGNRHVSMRRIVARCWTNGGMCAQMRDLAGGFRSPLNRSPRPAAPASLSNGYPCRFSDVQSREPSRAPGPAYPVSTGYPCWLSCGLLCAAVPTGGNPCVFGEQRSGRSARDDHACERIADVSRGDRGIDVLSFNTRTGPAVRQRA
jgi:hypothetical protein